MIRTCALSTAAKQQHPRVAIIGGGITGASAASVLAGSDIFSTSIGDCDESSNQKIKVDVFDQGRSGPGGRASRRTKKFSTGKENKTESSLKWDHGCQVCEP